MKTKTLIQTQPNHELKRYFLAFLLGFSSLLIVFLPIIIRNGGYFIYYGDFNSQQIPFYSLANDAVRSGSFGWNWYTDLGVNFIGSYSFYLLGSPFFWITTILPQDLVPFAIPYLLCVKHGVASLTAYAYIRRFVKNPNAALIGGMLYAFSGFQLFNLFFNHFQDVTAFFPLLLIAMEECVQKNRKGVFALSVALLATINYFFFTGQVVFLILYFIFRCFSKDFPVTFKKFWILALEACIGVLLACGMLLPSALAILANNRVSEHLYGLDMVVYSDRTRILRILLGMFLIPDVPARPNLFSSDYAKWASIGGYLPLFSMAGVLAFLKSKTGHWAKRLTIVCAVCACVPILNSAFYAFNGSYYARWFYMPVLILAMMTAVSLDEPEISWKSGVRFCAGIMAAFGLVSLLPVKENGEVLWFSFAEYPLHFYLVLGVCVVGLVVLCLLLRFRSALRRFWQITLAATTVFSIICTMVVVYFGAANTETAKQYIDKAIDPEKEISLSVSEDNFFRIDISENYDNYPMFWQLPCMRTFHSIVPASIMDFYAELGIKRDVASRADTSYYALRGLFSVKYYYENSTLDLASCDMPGFEVDTTENGFVRYENTAYIPMGFTFDSYITTSQWKNLSDASKPNFLVHSLVLTNDQVKKYGDWMEQENTSVVTVSESGYLEDCQARAASSCDSFSYDSDGFQASITLDSPNLVFFSVPYDEGWHATVNGESVAIEQVDTGFMAVPASAGENEIVFTYETPGLRLGGMLSLTGAVLFLGYLTVCYQFKRHRRKKEETTYASTGRKEIQ